MINLLPPERKARVHQEFLFRLLVSASSAIAGGFLVLILLLLLVRFSIGERVASQEFLLSSVRKEESAKEIQRIQSLNEILRELEVFYGKTPETSLLLDQLGRNVPEGVGFQSLSYSSPSIVQEKDQQKKKNGILSVSGLAQTREAMLEFKGNLEQDSSFTSVLFSTASLTSGRTNVSFSATMEVKELSQ